MAFGEDTQEIGPLFVTLAFDSVDRMDTFLEFVRSQLLTDYEAWLNVFADKVEDYLPSEVNIDGEAPEMLVTFEYE